MINYFLIAQILSKEARELKDELIWREGMRAIAKYYGVKYD